MPSIHDLLDNPEFISLPKDKMYSYYSQLDDEEKEIFKEGIKEHPTGKHIDEKVFGKTYPSSIPMAPSISGNEEGLKDPKVREAFYQHVARDAVSGDVGATSELTMDNPNMEFLSSSLFGPNAMLSEQVGKYAGSYLGHEDLGALSGFLLGPGLLTKIPKLGDILNKYGTKLPGVFGEIGAERQSLKDSREIAKQLLKLRESRGLPRRKEIRFIIPPKKELPEPNISQSSPLYGGTEVRHMAGQPPFIYGNPYEEIKNKLELPRGLTTGKDIVKIEKDIKGIKDKTIKEQLKQQLESEKVKYLEESIRKIKNERVRKIEESLNYGTQ